MEKFLSELIKCWCIRAENRTKFTLSAVAEWGNGAFFAFLFKIAVYFIHQGGI